MPTRGDEAGPPAGMLAVGRIGRPHGVRGDLYVHLYTDRHERLEPGSVLVTHGPGRTGELTVAHSRPVTDRWLVGFEGITDRTTAERWTSAELYATPIDDPDALWVHDLIGSHVVEADGTARGLCVAVVANPASDLLELESGALVPMTFVVSCADGVITIEPPVGLFEAQE